MLVLLYSKSASLAIRRRVGVHTYTQEGYDMLHLLAVFEEPGAAQMLEAALIDAFRGRVGCRNVAAGGEGPVGRSPYFTYCAVATCGPGRP